jgi:glutamate racemase
MYPLSVCDPARSAIVGESVRVIDPAPAVAKQTGRLLEGRGRRNKSGSKGQVKFYTSGDPAALKSLLPLLLGESGEVRKVEWLDDSSLKLTTETRSH